MWMNTRRTGECIPMASSVLGNINILLLMIKCINRCEVVCYVG